MNMPDPKTLGEQVERAFQDAVRKAVERHRRLGIPIAFMQDGKIVILEPVAHPNSGQAVEQARKLLPSERKPEP